MANGDVKLLGSLTSPYVIRARIALNIKSIEYEFLEETMAYKSDLLLKSNPVHKKIPVLIHNGKPVCESLIIVEYIDEVWSSGPSILPSDPYDRANARFWASYIDNKLFPIMKVSVMAEDANVKKDALEQVEQGLLVLEDEFVKCSKGKSFFSGDQIGLVDIAFGCNLVWTRVCEKLLNLQTFDEAKTPGLFKWAERFWSDPAVKDVMAFDELVELVMDLDKFKSSVWWPVSK